MIVMLAELPVAADGREAALDRLEELAVASRAEDGVVDYRVVQSWFGFLFPLTGQ